MFAMKQRFFLRPFAKKFMRVLRLRFYPFDAAKSAVSANNLRGVGI